MRRQPSGFSLPELIVVVTLIGLMTALAVPRFASLRDGAAVRAATTETARAFASAREYAVLRRSAVAVVIDTAGSAIELRSGGQTLMRRELGATYRVVLATNRDSAVYDARGFGYGASNLSLVLRRGQTSDTLVVSRLGRTRW